MEAKKRKGTAKGIRVSRKRGGSRGFTLLEIIMTLALLTIVGAIAYPSYSRMTANGNLRNAARDITGDMANLKERAMAQNTQFDMVFNVGGNTYTYPGLAAGKTPASFGRDIRLTGTAFGGGSTITFTTRGTLSQGGNVVLANGRGSTATITCNLSGRTYVQFNMQ